jgi:predicted DNA-binding transcriptional regulator AlpA
MICHIAMQTDATWRMQQPEIRSDNLSPLMTLDEVCRFFGGSAPLHPATIYRGIGVRYPRPVKIGPNSNRWFRTECEAALHALADRRSASWPAVELKVAPANVDAQSGIHARRRKQAGMAPGTSETRATVLESKSEMRRRGRPRKSAHTEVVS